MTRAGARAVVAGVRRVAVELQPVVSMGCEHTSIAATASGGQMPAATAARGDRFATSCPGCPCARYIYPCACGGVRARRTLPMPTMRSACGGCLRVQYDAWTLHVVLVMAVPVVAVGRSSARPSSARSTVAIRCRSGRRRRNRRRRRPTSRSRHERRRRLDADAIHQPACVAPLVRAKGCRSCRRRRSRRSRGQRPGMLRRDGGSGSRGQTVHQPDRHLPAELYCQRRSALPSPLKSPVCGDGPVGIGTCRRSPTMATDSIHQPDRGLRRCSDCATANRTCRRR